MLTALDWIILAVVGFSALTSVFRGFVKEASSIVSWVASFVVASRFYSQLAVYMTFSNDGLTRSVVASIILFVGTLLILGFISKVICSLVQKVGLSGFDRLLGVAFGVVRGVLIVCAVLALAQMLFKLHILTFVKDYSWYAQSAFVPELQRIVNWFFIYMGTPETGV
ncbi:MAG: CvpA family protein [Succinivibrio sp.]